MTVTKLTPKQLLDRMRKTTADMLGYDLSNLTPAQSIRLDRAASLRLELDDLQGKQLAGLLFDAKQYVVVSESLERMFGGDPEQPATAETDEQRRKRWAEETFAGAAEELDALLGRRAEALERRAEANKQLPVPDGGHRLAPGAASSIQLVGGRGVAGVGGDPQLFMLDVRSGLTDGTDGAGGCGLTSTKYLACRPLRPSRSPTTPST
jgi:hypothetical protein